MPEGRKENKTKRKVTKKEAENFCEACVWTFETYLLFRKLFGSKRGKNITGDPRFVYLFHRLASIIREYLFLQLGKLHDPECTRSKQGKSYNLSINYFCANGDWGVEGDEVKEIAKSLNEFWEKIEPARNKIIAHNDADVMVEETALGAFSWKEAREYILGLKRFVEIVHNKWISGPIVICDPVFIREDIYDFLDAMERGSSRRSRLIARAL